MQVGGIYTQGRGEPGGGGSNTRVKTLTNTQKRRVQRGRRRYGGRYRSARMTVEVRAGRIASGSGRFEPESHPEGGRVTREAD